MVPFEDDELDPGAVNRAGTTGGSFFSGKNGKNSIEEFEKKAYEIGKKSSEYKDRAADLAGSFKKILEDKTLIQNKNIFSNDLERELISKLVHLAIDMNTDENEVEGMGSVGIIALLLKTSLILRDRLNSAEYRCVLLENRLKEIESIVKKST